MPLDRKEETREAPSDPNEETREAPLSTEKETQEAPSDSEEETKDVAGFAVGSTDLEGLVVPARRKLTISGNLPPNNVIVNVESTGARRRERSNAAKFSVDERGRQREECVDVRRQGHGDFSGEGGDTRADSQGHVTEAVNRQQAMNALEMEERRKIRRKNKCKVDRPNNKLVVRARVVYKRKVKDGEVEKCRCRLVA